MLVVANDLLSGYNESNSVTIGHTQRSRGTAVAHRDRNIAGTIAVDEWTTVLRAIGEEAAALVYHAAPLREGGLNLSQIKQVGQHRQGNRGDEVAKIVNMEDARIDGRAMPNGLDAFQAGERGRVKGSAKIAHERCAFTRQVRANGRKEIGRASW